MEEDSDGEREMQKHVLIFFRWLLSVVILEVVKQQNFNRWFQYFAI